jgi:CRISPR-associated protein Cas1
VRRQLNTLYVTTEGAWLKKDGANVVMEVDGDERARLPIHMLASVVCFGRVMISPPLLGFCAESGVSVAYLSMHGRFLARVEGPVSGNVLLRREQYRVSDDLVRAVPIVRNIVAGKIHNQRAVLSRALRDYGDDFADDIRLELERAQKRLLIISRRLQSESDINVLRGLEGEAAQSYFSVFQYLVRIDEPAFKFNGRSRRPPLDAINAVLSFLYTLITHDCRSALETVGLDPAVGFLHRDRPGRPSLALDLIEEMRPVLADRLALSMINRKQLNKKDFRFLDNGACLLTETSRKALLIAYQERKRDEIAHPFLDEKVPLGMVPFVQAQLLARHLRGDIDAYPAYLWK